MWVARYFAGLQFENRGFRRRVDLEIPRETVSIYIDEETLIDNQMCHP